MTKNEVKQILEFLSGAYPKAGSKDGLGPDTIKVYALCLQDLPFDVAKAATLQHISSNKWFPSIAELREAALKMMPGQEAPTALEAWAEVQQAFRDIGSYGMPRFSHPAIAKAVDALDWQQLCLSENGMADRAHFMKLYDVYCGRLRDNIVMLPAVRETKQRLAAAVNGKIKVLADAKRADV